MAGWRTESNRAVKMSIFLDSLETYFSLSYGLDNEAKLSENCFKKTLAAANTI